MTQPGRPAPEMQAADPRMRRALLVSAAVLAVAGVAAVLALETYLQALQSFAQQSPESAAQRFLLLSRGFFAMPSLVLLGLAWHLGWRAWQGLRSGRMPPAGARLLRTTPVLHGSEARRRARRGLGLALLLGAAGILGPWLAYLHFVKRFEARIGSAGGGAAHSSGGPRPSVASASASAKATAA